MSWAALARGIRVGLNIATKLVTLGLIHGKAEKAIDIADKVERVVEDEIKRAKEPPAA